jgi:glucosyl-dolichyl phosphate glucuronosyltransferase
MLVTIAICTYNRAALLRHTLDRLGHAAVPEGIAVEVIVVNNNCTDGTAQFLRDYAGPLSLRVVFEPVPGVSNARNQVLAEAAGEYILWTDDDVLVDRHWITAYAAAFRGWPEAVFFGGPIEPWFEGTPPAWLERAWPSVATAFATLQLSDRPIAFDARVVPYGANFATRTAVSRRYPFDPTLGRRPNGWIGGEETAVMRAMLADGHSGVSVPEARVIHHIPAARQTKRYLRAYYAGQGQVAAQTFPPGGRTLFGRPLWLWKMALLTELRYRRAAAFTPPDVWIKELVTASYHRGLLRGR